uniref:Uncharacterized protein n=1 Tax=Trichogramma kaykai TaxID=54128 RepID=A0ABD2XMF7_9HYME
MLWTQVHRYDRQRIVRSYNSSGSGANFDRRKNNKRKSSGDKHYKEKMSADDSASVCIQAGALQLVHNVKIGSSTWSRARKMFPWEKCNG